MYETDRETENDQTVMQEAEVPLTVTGKKENGCRSILRDNAFLVCVGVGVFVGFGLGFGLRSSDLSADALMWLGLPGDVFMRMLKMTIIPLITGSIINGAATTDPKTNGRISVLTFGFIMAANFLGAVLGIIMYLIFRPGYRMVETMTDGTEILNSQYLQTQDMFIDLIRNLLPDNIVTATFQKTQTRYTVRTSLVENNGTNITIKETIREVGVASGINMLGIIFVSTVVGLAASSVKDSSVSFIPFFKATSDIFIKVMTWFIWSTPFGVASLICMSVVEVRDIEDTFKSLGVFVLAYAVGILIQQLVLTPIVYIGILRQNPVRFLLSVVRPYIATFAAASTAVALPEMINVCENKNHIDAKISRFVVPFGVAICRSGSSLFISLTALFVIALTGTQPSLYDLLLIGVLTTLGSLAIPAIPSASIVTVIVILASVNKDSSRVALLMALEWCMDRIRSTSNALHILTCAAVVNKLCPPKVDLDTVSSV